MTRLLARQTNKSWGGGRESLFIFPLFKVYCVCRNGEACCKCQNSLPGLQPAEDQNEAGSPSHYQWSREARPDQTEVGYGFLSLFASLKFMHVIESSHLNLLRCWIDGSCSDTRGRKHKQPRVKAAASLWAAGTLLWAEYTLCTTCFSNLTP